MVKPPRSFDILGNIAVVKFSREFKQAEKKKYAKELLGKNKSITTILEKTGKISGRLRKPTTKWVAGKKTKEVLYRENNCVFRFDIDKTYFSPRLSNERKEIASEIKKGEEVLVMFAGVAPFSIVVAKNSKAKKVYSNEINREANKYAKLNVELNKVKDKVILLDGDIKKIAEKLSVESRCPSEALKRHRLLEQEKKVEENRLGCLQFDVIVMPRPQLKETFLKQAFQLSKRGTRVYYYDFCGAEETQIIVGKIKAEAKKFRKKIKILKTKKAGEVAPYKIRVRVDFEVL